MPLELVTPRSLYAAFTNRFRSGLLRGRKRAEVQPECSKLVIAQPFGHGPGHSSRVQRRPFRRNARMLGPIMVLAETKVSLPPIRSSAKNRGECDKCHIWIRAKDTIRGVGQTSIVSAIGPSVTLCCRGRNHKAQVQRGVCRSSSPSQSHTTYPGRSSSPLRCV